MNSQTWYVVECSRVGADDWYTTGLGDYDTYAETRKAVNQGKFGNVEGFGYRIVKKTLTEEVVTA